MQKIISFVCFICFYLMGHSQINSGTWLIGGNAKLYSYKTNYYSPSLNSEANYTKIDISTRLGYFVIDKLAFGVIPSFSLFNDKGTSTSNLTTSKTTIWIGPFARYYFLDSEKQTNILSEFSYQYGFNSGSKNGKLNAYSIMAGPVFYFNKSVGLEFLLGYFSTVDDPDGSEKEIKNGLQFGIGFQIHFSK